MSLPGPPEVEKGVLDPFSGILAGLRPGGAYVDMTTNAPSVFRRIAESSRARGVEVLDAPVSGRPPGMTIMVEWPGNQRGRKRWSQTRWMVSGCSRVTSPHRATPPA
jgi:NAD binding domain of 6-phosphogluconate dehydrogenase